MPGRPATRTVQSTHGDTSLNNNTLIVSGNGGIVVFSELTGTNGASRYKSWDMLALKDVGDLFRDERDAQPTSNPSVCGISADGRMVLVAHDYKVPLIPERPASTAYTKLNIQLSRRDRVTGKFEYVAVSEESARSRDAGCDGFRNGSRSRQMSKDGNRVAWVSLGNFFVRDIAAQQTLKIKLSCTIYGWGLSGDGRYIVHTSGAAPDGTIYKGAQGQTITQIFRYGPLTANDFGAQFTLEAFEAKLISGN